MRFKGVPSTAIVRPPSLMAVSCAVVSMPSANPLTITTSRFDSTLVMWAAVLSPFADAFRDPMIATLGFGRGVSIGPAENSVEGAYFLSTSLRGPRSSKGVNVRISVSVGFLS